MRLMMNNLVMQTAAVGVIALVTMFPTTDRLKDAVSPSPGRTIVPTSVPTTVIVKATAYRDDPIIIQAPFDLKCAEAENNVSLSICAAQLWGYIQSASSQPASSALAASGSANPPVLNFRVEQARRTLVEVCRVRWSMKRPPADPKTDDICDTIL